MKRSSVGKIVQMFALLFVIAIFFVSKPNCAHASRIALSYGTLIKVASGPAVYLYANDEKRYVFPNDRIYFSWFENFDTVITISAEEMASISIGGNVTYHPAKQLVKLQTDPRVYAVGSKGVLRWVATEKLASELYGSDWAKMVHDLPESFFQDYRVERPIRYAYEYQIHWPIYQGVLLNEYIASKTVSDPVEVSDRIPLYPNGQVYIVEMSEEGKDTELVFETENARTGVLHWYDETLLQQGWKKGESLLFESVLKERFGARYEKMIQSVLYEWIMTIDTEGSLYQIQVKPVENQYTDTSILPVGTPIPDSVEVISVGSTEDGAYRYTGLSRQTARELFVLMDATLTHYGWRAIVQADQGDRLIRQYERQESDTLRNVGLFLIPIDQDTVLVIFVDGPSTLFDEMPIQEMAESFL